MSSACLWLHITSIYSRPQRAALPVAIDELECHELNVSPKAARIKSLRSNARGQIVSIGPSFRQVAAQPVASFPCPRVVVGGIPSCPPIAPGRGATRSIFPMSSRRRWRDSELSAYCPRARRCHCGVHPSSIMHAASAFS
ncbi:hypothetical protein LY76DRAFT_595596 [Colletotrichum caudatum]|nr:hypothetical protein LY76DRAFT_595596 [Colletotrichum caudatum]